MKALKTTITRKNSIAILTLIYLLPFFILITANMLFSLFQTTYMELYQDTEKPLYKSDSPIFLLVCTLLFTGILLFFFNKHKITDKTCAFLEKTALIWTVFISLFILFLFRVRVSCDSEHISDIAIAFLNGDYSSMTGDGYLVHYPHQLGMIGLLQTVYYLFGIENLMVLQFLNVIAVFSTVYYLHRITKEMFHQSQIQAILSLLCMGMLPLYLYTTFIYGDIPGLGLIIPAIYYLLRYLNTRQKHYCIPAFLCTTFAIVLKSNNSVILVAAVFILFLHTLQEKDKFALLFALLLISGPTLANTCIYTYYTNVSGLDSIPAGIPKIAWVAMGLQTNEYIENGWYNSYNWNIYSSHEYDTVTTTQACITSIKESVQGFFTAPKSGLQFFYRKFISQWNDPGYQAQITIEWYSRHRDDHSLLALWLIYGNGRFILEGVMNLYHFIILLGGSIYAFCSLRKQKLANTLLPLSVFGGYLFHLIWEAGGRYGLGYFILCVPMAAWGYFKLSETLSCLIALLQKRRHRNG